MKFYSFILAFIYFLFATSVLGRTVVDQNNEGSISGTWNVIPGNYSYQSFQTNAGNITGAEVNVVGANYTGDLVINLFDSIGGSILAHGSTTIAALQIPTWVHVDFAQPVELLSNTTYYLGITANSDVVRLAVSFDYSFPYGYEYGSAYFATGGESVTSDYLFRTFADIEIPFPWPAFYPAIVGQGN